MLGLFSPAHRLFYRQENNHPFVIPITLRQARKTIAALPVGTEWELYKRGLFDREWKMTDYGLVTK